VGAESHPLPLRCVKLGATRGVEDRNTLRRGSVNALQEVNRPCDGEHHHHHHQQQKQPRDVMRERAGTGPVSQCNPNPFSLSSAADRHAGVGQQIR